MKTHLSSSLSGHAYLSSFLLSDPVFADEVDKYFYLQMLAGEADSGNCRVITFSLMDDSLGMISVSSLEAFDPDEMILTGFHQDFLPYYKKRHQEYPQIRSNVESKLITSMEELLREMNKLHFLPRKKGAVEWITDYYWSGVQNYAGHFGWAFIDSEYLLKQLGSDPKYGKKLFHHFAREQYREEFGTLSGYKR